MSRTHILTPSWTSGATAISNGSATPATDADKLLQTQTSRKFRSDSDTSIRLTFDAGVAKPFNTVSLIAHNGVATDTITVTAHSSTGSLFTTPAFSFGPVPLVFAGVLTPFIERDIVVDVESTQTFRYIGIEIDASSNPDGYHESGVFMAGEDFEPGIGADIGWKTGWNDPSQLNRTINGEANVRPKRKYKVWDGNFPKQPFLDTVRFMAMNLIYGGSIPCVTWWEPPISGYQQYFINYVLLKWSDGGAFQYAHKDGLFDVGLASEGV